MCVFTQQAFPRCYMIPGITAEGIQQGCTHTHTHIHKQSTTSSLPPRRKREEGRLVGGRYREITDPGRKGEVKEA